MNVTGMVTASWADVAAASSYNAPAKTKEDARVGNFADSPLKSVREVSQNEILQGVANVLEHFIACSDKLLSSQIRATSFDGPEIPDLKVQLYLEHIMRSGLCSKECFIIALIYGERLLQRHKDFVISRRNVHRLLLVSTLVASKILDDFYCRNEYYATAGGLSCQKLNDLELKLCFLLDFDLNVDVEQFQKYCDFLRVEPAYIPQHCTAFPSMFHIEPEPSRLPVYPLPSLAAVFAPTDETQWPAVAVAAGGRRILRAATRRPPSGAGPHFADSVQTLPHPPPPHPRPSTYLTNASGPVHFSMYRNCWPAYGFPAVPPGAWGPYPATQFGPPAGDPALLAPDPLGASAAWFGGTFNSAFGPSVNCVVPALCHPAAKSYWSIPQPQIV